MSNRTRRCCPLTASTFVRVGLIVMALPVVVMIFQSTEYSLGQRWKRDVAGTSIILTALAPVTSPVAQIRPANEHSTHNTIGAPAPQQPNISVQFSREGAAHKWAQFQQQLTASTTIPPSSTETAAVPSLLPTDR